jgi:hypothetical protein
MSRSFLSGPLLALAVTTISLWAQPTAQVLYLPDAPYDYAGAELKLSPVMHDRALAIVERYTSKAKTTKFTARNFTPR